MSSLQKASQNDKSKAAKTNKPEPKARVSHAGSGTNPAQVLSSPETALPDDVLAAQQQVGNQVVQRAIDPGKHKNSVTDERGNLRNDISNEIQKKRGAGSPLPDSIRKEVSKKFGRSFNDVRLHTDDKADKLSRTINARAFTIGSDIFFKGGVFNSASSQGRETLVHELTHVVQQSGTKGASGSLKLGAPDTAMEKEADKMGKKHSQGKLNIGTGASGAVQGNAIQRKMSDGSAAVTPEQEADEPSSRRLNAHAFSQGSDIHLAQSQERHLPHEAWHVVQQQQARIDPTLQMQPEDEETLQTQPDSGGIVQRMGSDEEESLQMQPDTGGVVQRAWEKNEQGEWKKVEAEKPQAHAGFKKTDKGLRHKAMKDPDTQAVSPLPGSHQIRKQKHKLNEEIKNKPGTLKKVGFDAIEARQQKNQEAETGLMSKEKEQQAKEKNEQKAKFEKTIPGQRLKLMSTIKDPKASKEDVKAAEDKLKDLHKGAFSKKQITAAKDARKTAMKEAASRGDENAYKTMKSEAAAEAAEKEKNSKTGMVLGALGAAGGAVGGLLKSRLGLLADHAQGKKEGEKEKDTKSGGAASSGTLEMITQLHQENKSLKAELAKLKQPQTV